MKHQLRSRLTLAATASGRALSSRRSSVLASGDPSWSRRSRFCPAVLLLIVGVAIYTYGGPIEASASTGSPARHPESISFPTSSLVLALSIRDCKNQTCVGLQRSDDSGATWTSLPVPVDLARFMRMDSWAAYPTYFASGSLTVHFADARDGWIYGVTPAPVTSTTTNPNFAAQLWSTHDGGASWKKISLSSLGIDYGVVQMATHDAVTYLYGASFTTGHARILSTLSVEDRWTSATRSSLRLPAGGTQLQGSFTFSGNRGWFVGGNDRGIISLERLTPTGTWTKWQVRTLALGEGFAPVTAESSNDLIVVTSESGWIIPAPKIAPSGWDHGATWLFVSTNAGKTFRAIHEVANSSRVIFPFENGLPAVTKPGTILLEREQGTNATTFQLVASTNSGRSWHVVIGQRVLQVAVAATSVGYAIVTNNSDPRLSGLHKTTDGGLQWSNVAL